MRVTAELANRLREINAARQREREAFHKQEAAQAARKKASDEVAALESKIFDEIPDEHGEWLVEEIGTFFRIAKYKPGFGVNSIRVESVHRYGA